MSLVLTKWEGMRYCCYSGNFSWVLGVYSTNKKKKSEKRILIDKNSKNSQEREAYEIHKPARLEKQGTADIA